MLFHGNQAIIKKIKNPDTLPENLPELGKMKRESTFSELNRRSPNPLYDMKDGIFDFKDPMLLNRP